MMIFSEHDYRGLYFDILRDGVPLMYLATVSTTAAKVLGRNYEVFNSVNFPLYAMGVITVGLSGMIGREIAINKTEHLDDPQRKILCCVALAAGVGIGATLLTKNGIFPWGIFKPKTALATTVMAALPMCISDYRRKEKCIQEPLRKEIEKVRKELESDHYSAIVNPLQYESNGQFNPDVDIWNMNHWNTCDFYVDTSNLDLSLFFAREAIRRGKRYNVPLGNLPQIFGRANIYYQNVRNIKEYKDITPNELKSMSYEKMCEIRELLIRGEYTIKDPNKRAAWSYRSCQLRIPTNDQNLGKLARLELVAPVWLLNRIRNGTE